MKKILFISMIISIVFYSCEFSPEAHFKINTNEPVVGQEVIFTNQSQNAQEFEWDFGDGFISNEKNPGHTFNSTGTFEVTLTAISKSGIDDKASLTLEVVVPTLLVIEVREYYQDYLVPDASIILYSSLSDWDAADEKRLVSEAFTDANGIGVFSNLDPLIYYTDVWEATHDNYTLRTEDVGFIRTPKVLAHQINWFVAYVDVANHTKGAMKGDRQLIIKKFERKPIDKNQNAPAAASENWKDLFNRSVGK